MKLIFNFYLQNRSYNLKSFIIIKKISNLIIVITIIYILNNNNDDINKNKS